MTPTPLQIAAAAIFAAALLHAFSAGALQRLAHRHPRHAGALHLLGEVEVVFGVWAMVLVVAVLALAGPAAAVAYVDGRDFTEPLFVFAIMVVAGSRPNLRLVTRLVEAAARALPLPRAVANVFLALAAIPLLGSLVTEPAAMTLAALLLRDRLFVPGMPERVKYAALGVLFVNVSIGGTLTAFAAPPVLMVAARWQWDTAFMLQHFGGRTAAAVVANAAAVCWIFRRELVAHAGEAPMAGAAAGRATGTIDADADAATTGIEADAATATTSTSTAIDAATATGPRPEASPGAMLVAVLALAGVALASHHPPIFLGLLLFFIGARVAYPRHHDPLILREALLVGFFLAGLVVLGGQQQWWLQPLLVRMSPSAVFYGAAALTALTDNAALTYLGSLVEGLSDEFKLSLVAGAVTGGGLTVIANAPNPAGLAILRGGFREGVVNAGWLLAGAAGPTVAAVVAYRWL